MLALGFCSSDLSVVEAFYFLKKVKIISISDSCSTMATFSAEFDTLAISLSEVQLSSA